MAHARHSLFLNQPLEGLLTLPKTERDTSVERPLSIVRHEKVNHIERARASGHWKLSAWTRKRWGIGRMKPVRLSVSPSNHPHRCIWDLSDLSG
jgi:hypothetical protein